MPKGKGDPPQLSASGTSNGSIASIESRELPYFYSNFSSTDEVAEYLLHKSGSRAGYFLVRPSFKNRSMLTVSVVVADKSVRHTNIIVEGQGALKKYYLVKEKKFDSVDELIQYYQEHDVKNLQKVSHVRFLHPLNRPNYRHGDSNSSGGSNYTRISTSSDNSHSAGQTDRPPLPARPTNLQRYGSENSFNSQMSVFTQGSVNSSTSVLPNGEVDGIHRGPSENSISPESMGHSNWNLESNSSNLPSPTDNIARRPPVPIPQIPRSDNPYYSSPRDVNESIKEELKKVIRESERCDCGIPRDLSDLPLGWTVHRSKDAQTYGRIFYQNESGVTSWKLPEDVMRKLTVQHKTNLQKVKMMKYNDNDYLENNSPQEFMPRSPSNRSNGSGSGGAEHRFSDTKF